VPGEALNLLKAQAGPGCTISMILLLRLCLREASAKHGAPFRFLYIIEQLLRGCRRVALSVRSEGVI